MMMRNHSCNVLKFEKTTLKKKKTVEKNVK